jgi:hypothetical protein
MEIFLLEHIGQVLIIIFLLLLSLLLLVPLCLLAFLIELNMVAVQKHVWQITKRQSILSKVQLSGELKEYNFPYCLILLPTFRHCRM